MFATNDEVMRNTPYENVTNDEVRMAQFVIEMYVGRSESEVDYARDKGLLKRATIAQCVYMRDNTDITFEQIAASNIARGDGITTFKYGDFTAPWIAPLAVMACKHLSWKGTRNIKTGRTMQRGQRVDWSRD